MHVVTDYYFYLAPYSSSLPRGLRRRSAADRLLRSWVRIPPGSWMFLCCEFYVLSGRGLCDELITRPVESYRLWCVVVCDLETSRMRRPWPALGRSTTGKKKLFFITHTISREGRQYSAYRHFSFPWVGFRVSYINVLQLLSLSYILL